MITFAIIGKTNVGKTTLFYATTLLEEKISNFPFTAMELNQGLNDAPKGCGQDYDPETVTGQVLIELLLTTAFRLSTDTRCTEQTSR